MPPLNFDPEQTERKEFEPANPGRYAFIIEECTEKQSRSGNPMLSLVIKAKNDEKPNGITVYDYLVLTPNSQWKCEDCMEAVGMDPKKPQDYSPEDFVGKSGAVQLKRKPDSKFLEVAFYIKGEEGSPGNMRAMGTSAGKDEPNEDEIPW